MLRLGLALTLLASTSAFGQERQYRSLELTDGRRINAEVLATEPTGLRMRIPQGETLVSFELLVNISPIESAAFAEQPPVRVWVHSPDKLDEVAAVYENLPNTLVSTGQSASGLPPGLVVQLDQCGPDFTCLADALDGEDWMWLVTVLPPPDDSDAAYVWRGRGSGGPPITRRDQRLVSPDTFWRDGHEVLGLIPTSNPPKAVRDAFVAGGTAIPTARDLQPRSTKTRNALFGGFIGGAALAGGSLAVGSLGDAGSRPGGDAYILNTIGLGVFGAIVGGAIGHTTGKTILPEVGVRRDGAHGAIAITW